MPLNFDDLDDEFNENFLNAEAEKLFQEDVDKELEGDKIYGNGGVEPE